jgi:hypothetical protein
MVSKSLMKILAMAILVAGIVLLVATARIASALGAIGDGAQAGGSDPASMAFWFQLSFVRLFATALLGLSAILLWSASQLSVLQQRSLALVLAGVMGGLALMAVAQQVAIWNSNAGWLFAVSLVVATVMCLLVALQPAVRHAV